MTNDPYKYTTSYQKILGVDPGETVGIFHVMLSTVEDSNGSHTRADYTRYELGYDSATGIIKSYISGDPGLLVAVEQFIITTKTGKLSQQPAPLKFIGVVQEYCDNHGNTMVLQAKSNVAKMASDKVLKNIRWYNPSQGHSNDAARHALFALSGVKPTIFRKLMLGGTIDNNEIT